MYLDPWKLLRHAYFDDPPPDPPTDGGGGNTPPPGNANSGDPPPAAPQPDWRDREISSKHRQLKERDARIAELERQLNERSSSTPPPVTPAPTPQPPPQPQPQQPVPAAKTEDQLRKEIADAAKVEAQQIVRKENFDRQSADTVRKGVEAYGQEKWVGALNTLEQLGGVSQDELEMMMGVENPHQVLYELGTNPAKVQELRNLSVAQRLTEYVKMGMTKQAVPAAKPSSTPAPVTPLGGRPAAVPQVELKDDLSDDEWYRIRAQQKKESVGRPWSLPGR